MKWYMALNECGTQGDIALHAKLAVISALLRTSLRPNLMYVGQPNEFTRWMSEHNVNVINSQLPYAGLIERLTKEGRYTQNTLGHWLRTNVCLEELTETRVFYTDVDVVFRKQPSLDALKPKCFAAAPEFGKDTWNYFNAGVMLINIPELRRDYERFEEYLRLNIEEKTFKFHDQIAYNIFYRGRWEQLPITLNWKPYWGFNSGAEVLHYHGPKITAMEMITGGSWDWASGHGVQIGSLFVSHVESYKSYVHELVDLSSRLSPSEQDRISKLYEKICTVDPEKYRPHVSLEFTKFRMFPE